MADKTTKPDQIAQGLFVSEAENQLVLRTVFIPSKHDQELRDVAGQLHVSKGEIIRRAIESYLSHPELRGRSSAAA